MLTAKIAVGFIVGTLVGLSGLGGGVLLMPVLVFGLHVPPIMAVGSDMLCNAITKIGAGYVHWRHRSVNWTIVGGLSCGSVPGVIAGVTLLGYLRTLYGAGVNNLLKELIGIVLLCVPILFLLQGKLQQELPETNTVKSGFSFKLVITGLVAGFLVGMTSVGSGSIVMVFLLLLRAGSPRVLVGTDIAHAIILTGVASILHWNLGTIDPHLAGALLLGAIPGGIFGSQLSNYIPALWTRRLLCGLLLVTGARMLV